MVLANCPACSFETAVQEDVEELRNRYNYLASVGSAENKAITLSCKDIARLDQQMHDIVSYTNVLTASLNILMRDTKIAYSLCILSQDLSALEFTVNSLLHNNPKHSRRYLFMVELLLLFSLSMIQPKYWN